MARSYRRGKASRKGGLLVRENPKTNAVSVNSLYCVPVRLTIGAGATPSLIKTDSNFANNWTLNFYQVASGDPVASVAKVVRVSSMECSSKSPFTITINGTTITSRKYKCVGQSVNKIVLSRETSLAGNPAALNKAGNNAPLVGISDNEDQVDITIYVVVASDLG